MKTVVFDVGNVLLRWNPVIPFRNHFSTDDEIATFFEHVNFSSWNISLDAGRDWDEAVASLSEKHPNYAKAIVCFQTHWHESIVGTIDGAVSTLRHLHKSGRKVYAITNFSHPRWVECLDRFDFLDDCFEDVVVSGEHKMLKPNAEIYELLLQRNQLSAEDCIFIDDSLPNINSAKALGFGTIHFSENTDLTIELDRQGVAL